MFRFLKASEKDDPGLITKLKDRLSKELQARVDQITETAAATRKATETAKNRNEYFNLEQENKDLREILQITRESFLNPRKDDASEKYIALSDQQ